MDIAAKIAEEKIKRAIEEGLFDNLKGSGKPLFLDDDRFVPEDLRLAYRILKNANCIPPELELRNEIFSLGELMEGIDDDKERLKKLRELNFKLMKLNMMLKRPIHTEDIIESLLTR